MPLSSRAREHLIVGLANKAAGTETADLIDKTAADLASGAITPEERAKLAALPDAGLVGILLGSKVRVYDVALESFRIGAGTVSKDTLVGTPRIAGWKFTSTADQMDLVIDVPEDIDTTRMAFLELKSVLTATETVGDVLNWSVDWIAVQDSISGDGATLRPNSTSTRNVAVLSGKNGAGYMYTANIMFDSNDATNPFTDEAYNIFATIRRPNVGGAGYCGNVLLVKACFHYTSKI